jgi:hypothetical protein
LNQKKLKINKLKRSSKAEKQATDNSIEERAAEIAFAFENENLNTSKKDLVQNGDLMTIKKRIDKPDTRSSFFQLCRYIAEAIRFHIDKNLRFNNDFAAKRFDITIKLFVFLNRPKKESNHKKMKRRRG